MAIVDIPNGQQVCIPAVRLTDGKPFEGFIKAGDGEMLIVEMNAESTGLLPDKVDAMCVLTWQSEGIQRSCPFLVRSKNPRALVGQVVIQERRASPRVRVEMDMFYEVVPPTRVAAAAEEVLAQIHSVDATESNGIRWTRTSPDALDPIREDLAGLRELIVDLMARVDDLSAVVAGEAREASSKFKRPVCILNCSGTGLGFIGNENHPQGEYIRMQITLRTTPKVVIDCLGVVVRSTPIERAEEDAGGARFDVGVCFTHIHEGDREKLIQYLFKAQRRLLRDRREAREALSGAQS